MEIWKEYMYSVCMIYTYIHNSCYFWVVVLNKNDLFSQFLCILNLKMFDNECLLFILQLTF